jgi:hypothetical protein
MRWQKGQSGNPGGRRKEDNQVKELAKQHTALALETLVNLCQNGKAESTKLAAAIALLDRGWGRPAQAIIGGDEDDPPIQLSEIVIRAVDAASNRPPEKGG